MSKPGPRSATAQLLFRETWKSGEDPKTEWLPSCLSGREPRAATWRRLRHHRRRLRGPCAWPLPFSACGEQGRGQGLRTCDVARLPRTAARTRPTQRWRPRPSGGVPHSGPRGWQGRCPAGRNRRPETQVERPAFTFPHSSSARLVLRMRMLRPIHNGG